MKNFRKNSSAKQKSFARSNKLKDYSKFSERDLLTEFRTGVKGLVNEDAQERLEEYGPNVAHKNKPTSAARLFLNAFINPFVFILILLAVISLATDDVEAAIVMSLMVLCSVLITFNQEYRAQKSSLELQEMIENTCAVMRDGHIVEIPMDEVVPGDVVILGTGDMIPADGVLLWTKDLFINQASLTGESLPVEKYPENTLETENVIDLQNLVFTGTDVLSGQGKLLVVATGADTIFGEIAAKVGDNQKIKTSFDNSISSISKLLLRMIFVMFPIVLVLNGVTKGAWGEAFMFAISVAVGLTPEMLPMIVTSNLAKGAMALSKHKVIVKKLPAIQNLGSMDILCTDKTGTITEDRVVLVEHVDPFGNEQHEVLRTAYLNSYYQTGWKNLMDIAVINYADEHPELIPFNNVRKIDEIPFDFSRRRLTVVVDVDGHQAMITKGAVEEMFEVCSHVQLDGEIVILTDELREDLRAVNARMNEKGMRVITVAQKLDVHDDAVYSVDDERDMTIIGFVGFLDPAKESAISAIASLHDHGCDVKVLTGDNEIVSRKVCRDVGIAVERVVLGVEVDKMSDAELTTLAEKVNLFAKLNPLQKSRIIECLKANGHTVGFMGDGINDAPSLRVADVGISVDTAADITKEAADIILLEKSLNVLEVGVLEGRKVFTNMMKYIKITLSSNFGNVFSVLVASAFLPFLPMLPIQLLVQNLIYDISQLTLPWDNVDTEDLEKPVVWSTRGLLNFAIIMGPVSSIFDVITFIVMWFGFGCNDPHNLAKIAMFQAGWFAVGLATQAVAVQVLRTRHIPFTKNISSLPVLATLVGVFAVGAIVMFTSVGKLFDFVHLPTSYWPVWGAILVAYIVLLQIVKIVNLKLTKKWI